MKQVYLVILIVLFSIVPPALAEVKINEFYPGGSPEWVELYNPDNTEAILTDWYLDDVADKGSSPKKFSLSIPALGFGVVELGSMLNNSNGDSVRLLNPEQTETDRYDYTETVGPLDYFVRCPDAGDTWILINQSSKQESNINVCLSLTPTLTIAPTPTIFLTPVLWPTPTIQDTPGVVVHTPGVVVHISEVMVYPDNEAEWVELYNNNDFEVKLIDWYMDDGADTGSTPKKFSLTIAAKKYAVFELPSNIYNNDKDTVRLLNANQEEVESLEYSQAKKGQSYSRQQFTADATWCFTSPSKNLANHSCSQELQILGVTDVISISPTVLQSKINSQSNSGLVLPSGFQLHTNLYKLNAVSQKAVTKTHRLSSSLNKQFHFWLRCTKISLWLNFILNVTFLIYLSLFSRRLFL